MHRWLMHIVFLSVSLVVVVVVIFGEWLQAVQVRRLTYFLAGQKNKNNGCIFLKPVLASLFKLCMVM